MRGFEKMQSVERSTPAMEQALPALPMPETVLVRLIRITTSSMGVFFEPVFRATGLTENTFHVLCLLMAARGGSLAPSELSELVGTSRANMTRLLALLEKDKLVKRESVSGDGRRQNIRITPAGRKACTETAPKLAAPLLSAFSCFSPEEFQLFSELLRKLIVSFDENQTPNALQWLVAEADIPAV